MRRCLLVVLLLIACGCAGRGDLKGTVSYQDKTVQVGTVQAAGYDGVPRFSPIKDGSYEIKDLPAGGVRMTVSSPDPVQVGVGMRKQGEKPPPTTRAGWFPIPEKYADFNTSDLTFDLQRGPNTHHIKLE
jgi:hypothetical protein